MGQIPVGSLVSIRVLYRASQKGLTNASSDVDNFLGVVANVGIEQMPAL